MAGQQDPDQYNSNEERGEAGVGERHHGQRLHVILIELDVKLLPVHFVLKYFRMGNEILGKKRQHAAQPSPPYVSHYACQGRIDHILANFSPPRVSL